MGHSINLTRVCSINDNCVIKYNLQTQDCLIFEVMISNVFSSPTSTMLSHIANEMIIQEPKFNDVFHNTIMLAICSRNTSSSRRCERLLTA